MDDGRGSIWIELEKKLNYAKWAKRGTRDTYSRISLNQYWDLLKYVDDDYLTEWEVLKFKDLYGDQLMSLVSVHWLAFSAGFALSYPIMSPIIRGSTHGYLSRMPVGFLLGFCLSHQSGFWCRPNQIFHEILTQPNPHGSYIRKLIKYHFPRWWSELSGNLHENGYNLVEMNEYDKQIKMPELDNKFDSAML